ncbi:MAG: sigma-54 dependent transcriptional regulator [Bacteroidales bacterium]|nr:sigma-54 dependent transcriptional regulator [Bacteroidales bacterium]MCF8332721.1 sigma-54 dependent transcriptional regulator [Bacteroidales bacterium]
MDLQAIKQRFGVIGNSPELNRAIDTAAQVAPTDISVLITGESGVGKEVFPQIIHQLSPRKHGPYIAVNCGAIPEGTIDSELFGHEKGSFTGAHEARKGYFEVVNGGTIFLDEISELPLSTQVRLLRVLESGEFIKVGSSKVLKTDVRIVAASNIDMNQAIEQGKFREDLFYRLSTVPIFIPPLRDRKDDIYLLFRKFSADFAEKYRMPPLRLTEDARKLLLDYRWPGNVRQLKNITEQISIIEKDRHITSEVLRKYLPKDSFSELPVLYKGKEKETMTDRDLLYKVLFDMKKDINDLKKVVVEIMRERGGVPPNLDQHDSQVVKKYFKDVEEDDYSQTESADNDISISEPYERDHQPIEHSEVLEESLSLQKKEVDLIKKALEKHDGKRKAAARELGISERTLYRKIKEYDIK